MMASDHPQQLGLQRQDDMKEEKPIFADRIARCTRDQISDYMGVHRAPKLPDESGAVPVIEAIAGGRLVFFPAEKPWFAVRFLP